MLIFGIKLIQMSLLSISSQLRQIFELTKESVNQNQGFWIIAQNQANLELSGLIKIISSYEADKRLIQISSMPKISILPLLIRVVFSLIFENLSTEFFLILFLWYLDGTWKGFLLSRYAALGVFWCVRYLKVEKTHRLTGESKVQILVKFELFVFKTVWWAKVKSEF